LIKENRQQEEAVEDPPPHEGPQPQQVPALLNIVRQRVLACRSISTAASTAIASVGQCVQRKPKSEDAPIPYWTAETKAEGKETAKVALRYLIVPATSVPSERMFSRAGQISERRSSLKPEKACMLIFLRQNKWLYQGKQITTSTSALREKSPSFLKSILLDHF